MSDSRTTTHGMDSEIDFAQLVLRQIDRCNVALTQGHQEFVTAVAGFSCMLSHLKQTDELYHKEIKEIKEKYNKELDYWRGERPADDLVKIDRHVHAYDRTIIKQMKMAAFNSTMNEYELLIRLAARNKLFPSKRGTFHGD